MADRTIGSLPHAPDLYDDSLLVIEQQGAAMSLSGAQLKKYAREGVQGYVGDAQSAAQAAQNAAQTAQNSARTAQQYSGKPPIIQAGYWWTWNADQQKYVNTGKRSVLNFDKVYASVAAMNADKANVEEMTTAIISSTVDDPANAAIYIFDGTDWNFLADLSGFTGVGIQSITQTSGDHSPGTTDTYTILCTDGSSYTFTVKNGPPGPKGEKGEPGTSFTVLGRYDTLAALKAAHPAGSEGEAWAVGSAEDNEIYLWDVDALEWKNIGSLQGPPGPAGAGGVTSFNGRTGDVKPAAGDYTAAQVGALSQSVADNRYIRPGGAYPDASYTTLGSFSFGDDGILVVGNGELSFEDVKIGNITYLRIYGVATPNRDDGIVNKAYVDGLVGDISSILDSILGEVV